MVRNFKRLQNQGVKPTALAVGYKPVYLSLLVYKSVDNVHKK